MGTEAETPFRVMLAAESAVDAVGNIIADAYSKHLPVLGSYKLDGIRSINRGGVLISRSAKPIRSNFVQSNFGKIQYEDLDGELVLAGEVPAGDTLFHASQSACMTIGDNRPLNWFLFDCFHETLQYNQRREILREKVDKYPSDYVHILEQRLLENMDEVFAMEKEALDGGHEGLILRIPHAPYKQNRSSFKQGYLMKLARWMTSEAEIIGFHELMHNDNEAKLDERGFTKRSSHQENKRPAGMLGAFQVRDLKTGQEFKLSGELDHAMKLYIWTHQDEYLGKIAKYKFKPYGTKEAPRQPIFIGFRDPDDMS